MGKNEIIDLKYMRIILSGVILCSHKKIFLIIKKKRKFKVRICKRDALLLNTNELQASFKINFVYKIT